MINFLPAPIQLGLVDHPDRSTQISDMTDHVAKEKRSQIMASVRSRNTGPELTVRSALHRLGYRFRLHRRDLPGSPDIVFPSKRKVIFVHGCYWHGHGCRWSKLPKTNVEFWRDKIGRNQQRDLSNIRSLTELGWSSHTIWQCELRLDLDLSLAQTVEFLDRG